MPILVLHIKGIKNPILGPILGPSLPKKSFQFWLWEPNL